GTVSGGRLWGMLPTTRTPCRSRSNTTTASVAAATAAIGPALATRSAGRGCSPALVRSGFRPLRTQKRNAVESTPMTSVGRLVSGRLASNVPTSSGIASPEAELEHAHKQQDQARKQRQHQSRGNELPAARRRHAAR